MTWKNYFQTNFNTSNGKEDFWGWPVQAWLAYLLTVQYEIIPQHPNHTGTYPKSQGHQQMWKLCLNWEERHTTYVFSSEDMKVERSLKGAAGYVSREFCESDEKKVTSLTVCADTFVSVINQSQVWVTAYLKLFHLNYKVRRTEFQGSLFCLCVNRAFLHYSRWFRYSQYWQLEKTSADVYFKSYF